MKSDLDYIVLNTASTSYFTARNAEAFLSPVSFTNACSLRDIRSKTRKTSVRKLPPRSCLKNFCGRWDKSRGLCQIITRNDCAYRKCYPARMRLKSATHMKPKMEASLVRRLECNNVTLRQNRWTEFLRTTGSPTMTTTCDSGGSVVSPARSSTDATIPA